MIKINSNHKQLLKDILIERAITFLVVVCICVPVSLFLNVDLQVIYGFVLGALLYLIAYSTYLIDFKK